MSSSIIQLSSCVRVSREEVEGQMHAKGWRAEGEEVKYVTMVVKVVNLYVKLYVMLKCVKLYVRLYVM